MQPPTAPPRDTLTQAQVVALIQDSSHLKVGYGCELLDTDLNVTEDISADVAGGSVTRNSYATLHGTATVTVTRELDWGRAVIRPYLTLSDGAVSATFHLGAYYTGTPTRDLEETPPTYEATCYDILSVLTDPVGDTYAVAAGTAYLAAVGTILAARGVTAYTIDQAAAATVLPTDRLWIFDERTTWLSIVNDLLASIGYAGIWSDWDGRLRCQPYESPRQRTPEWTYDTDAATSMVSTSRTVERDLYGVPNRWVFYRSNNTDAAAPVEGNGLHTHINQSTGDTSIDARNRTITRVVAVDAADHTALVASAQITIDADMSVAPHFDVRTSPNPLHWHFDRLYYVDPAYGPPLDVLGTGWTLPLDGGDMTHSWTGLQQ